MRFFFSAWACFSCRKSFKKPNHPVHRSQLQPFVACPDCKGRLEWMGRSFAAPRQSDTKGWKEAQEQWRQQELQKIACKSPWQRRNEDSTLSKKLQAKQDRKIERASWLKKTRRKRYLKNLEEWTRAQS